MEREGKETPHRIPAAIKYLFQLRKNLTLETFSHFFNTFNLNFDTNNRYLFPKKSCDIHPIHFISLIQFLMSVSPVV